MTKVRRSRAVSPGLDGTRTGRISVHASNGKWEEEKGLSEEPREGGEEAKEKEGDELVLLEKMRGWWGEVI